MKTRRLQVNVSANVIPEVLANVCASNVPASVTSSRFHLYRCFEIRMLLSGHMQMGRWPVTLDFGAGLIRHEATVDYDGLQWCDDIVRQVGVAQSSAPGRFSTGNSYVWPFYVITVVNEITLI
ncbi:hypothetical protein CTI12_AA438510 [Artemisia annua]|uniref:Uncharacterized protein n=1 Tax=Artemisia annua TaxID=35608 RepID=A0A2U1LYQ4_ARTAN|nr:hypothetical protein CTI12_AA438510 [Artemisia annua]